MDHELSQINYCYERTEFSRDFEGLPQGHKVV